MTGSGPMNSDPMSDDPMSDDDVLRAVGDSVSAFQAGHRPSVEQIKSRARAQQRRRLLPAAGALVAAGAVALAVTSLVPGASHRPHARLDAWTVSKQADGDIQVTISQLEDPSGLQATLRADGVPASVTFGQQNPACQSYPQTEGNPGLISQVFGIPPPGEHPAGAYVYDIDPSALPSGAGVEIVLISESQNAIRGSQNIVYTSPDCTGS
jgi:hypothetical protein